MGINFKLEMYVGKVETYTLESFGTGSWSVRPFKAVEGSGTNRNPQCKKESS
jgi:hypothetical protein